jgi:lipopolysaccharide transport system permease protein
MSMATWLRDLWRFRRVLVALSLRDIRGKYKQAALGVAWAVIQPLVQVSIFTFVFRGVAKIETPVAYPVFALAALLPFNLFQQLVVLGTPAFANSQSLVTKVYFPRLYTVLAGGASALVNAAVTSAVLLVAMFVFGVPLSARILLALPTLAGILLLGVGSAALLGAVNARFRDVQHALPLVTTVLLYISPVLYPLASMPASLRPVALLNPLTGLIEGFRFALAGTGVDSWAFVASSLGASAVVFVVGVWVFERTQAELIDVL